MTLGKLMGSTSQEDVSVFFDRLPMIGKPLGYTRSAATTQRYAHPDNDPLKKASELIGSRCPDGGRKSPACDRHQHIEGETIKEPARVGHPAGLCPRCPNR
jgi:hypothetical protein